MALVIGAPKSWYPHPSTMMDSQAIPVSLQNHAPGRRRVRTPDVPTPGGPAAGRCWPMSAGGWVARSLGSATCSAPGH